jgi:hypothetical protein
MPGAVQISRVQHAVYFNRSFDIFVDGTKAGSIANGERATLQIEPGRHKIYTAIGLWKSKTVDVDITSGALKEIECGINRYSALVLPMVACAILIAFIICIVSSPDSLAAHICTGGCFIGAPIAFYFGTRPGQYMYLKESSATGSV